MQRGETGQGYVYYRDRSRGFDVTVYEHQLVALVDEAPADVFDGHTEVHHRNRFRLDNRRSNLEVLDRGEHRTMTNIERVSADD